MVLAGRWGYFKGTTTAPVPQDPSNPTPAENLEAQRWEREDVITQCLLGQRLPDEISMDMDEYPTVKEQWDALTLLATPKTAHTQANMHQSFLDMQCPKGGDIWEFLSSLKKRCHELKAANVTVTKPEYKRTIIHGVPDPLSAYTSQTMGLLCLTCKLTRSPFDMTDVIDTLCKEADHIKTVKDLAQGQGKGKNWSMPPAPDEALTATGTFEGSDGRRRKGKCHHCGKEGHWARECRTRKREEATVAADQNAQAVQSNPGTTSRHENKPMGSANHVTTDDDDSDDRGFWAVKEVGCAHPNYVEPDPHMDDSDSDDEDKAFRAETWGMEDEGGLDWAGLEDQLVKEGEEQEAEEEAGAAALPKEDSTPRTRSQPVPHNVPHALNISSNLEPHRAPDEEGHMPHIGDGCLRTISSHGAQVADTMRHAHHPHDVMRSPECTHSDDPEPAIWAHEGWPPGFDAVMQAHQAPWPRLGTVSKEQDVSLASAALLEGEEQRMPDVSSEQTAAPATPSNFSLPKSPTSPLEAASPLGPDSLPAQPHRTVHTLKPLCISHGLQAEEAVHPGTNPFHLAPGLQALGAFAEGPDAAGGVTTTETGAPAPLKDSGIGGIDPDEAVAYGAAVQGDTLSGELGNEDIALVDVAALTLDTNNLEPLSAPVPHLTGPAPASTAECATTRDVPHRKAVNTSHWAALATRPDTIFPGAHGSTAADQRATSGHAFPINNGAIRWPPRQQDDISPTTPKYDSVVAMHGGKEASRPPSPISITFVGFKALTTSPHDNHLPLAFMRDRHYHPPDHAHRRVALHDPTGLQPVDDAVADVPSNPHLPPRERTLSHPLDCTRSEGECHRSGSRPGPPDQDHTAHAAGAQHASILYL